MAEVDRLKSAVRNASSTSASVILGIHYQVLMTLSGAPDRALRLSDLAEAANVSRSRLTHRIAHLVESGYVELRPDADDLRSKHAVLTKEGTSFLNAITPAHQEDIRLLLFDHLTNEQTQALADAMAVIGSALHSHSEYLNPRLPSP